MGGWLLDTVRWTDALDVGLMSFIVYRVLLILRGTRTIQTMAGLLVLMGLYALSSRMDLITVHWMLDKFFFYIVLAVIILFQQDIRKALARAGDQLFLTSGRAHEGLTLRALEEIVRASFAMASRRVGALIAIEQAASLAEYVDPATRLDADVSHDLLLAVFHPTSPLHDGAVVLQKGRLAAAGVFLPLTQAKNISRFYGTRHRAAIGLTEETDAIIIVVSEERGTVSIGRNGQLTACDDANDMRARLQRLLKTPETGAAA
jgi:diadenylate cyclase